MWWMTTGEGFRIFKASRLMLLNFEFLKFRNPVVIMAFLKGFEKKPEPGN